jgi:hypothetical protein
MTKECLVKEITFNEYKDMYDLSTRLNIPADNIINIESIPYSDKPLFFYRVWYFRELRI